MLFEQGHIRMTVYKENDSLHQHPSGCCPPSFMRSESCWLWDLPSMLGCCESWGDVSCGSGNGRVGPQHYPSFPLAPFWRSDPRCYHCTTWPNRLRTAVPAGLLSTPADLQSPGLASPGGQRLPAAGIWHPAGPSAQQTPEPACSGIGRRISSPWLDMKANKGLRQKAIKLDQWVLKHVKLLAVFLLNNVSPL